MARLERKAHNLLKLVLEVADTSLVRIKHCKSQRLVLSVKGKEQLNTRLCNLQDAFYCTSVTVKGNPIAQSCAARRARQDGGARVSIAWETSEKRSKNAYKTKQQLVQVL